MGNKLKSIISATMIQRYEIVEASSIQDLVRLVNLKTKNGWLSLGGMAYAPTNFCVLTGEVYPFCQTVTRFEKGKKTKNGNNL
jgi:hypothetical protein